MLQRPAASQQQWHQQFIELFSEAVVRRCSGKNVFTKFTGKHLCQSLFFNKVVGLGLATLFKKRLWHRCFPVNFVKFLRPPFSLEYLWWLLLSLVRWLQSNPDTFYPFKHQTHKMVKYSETIRRQIAEELFECVWPFCGVGA